MTFRCVTHKIIENDTVSAWTKHTQLDPSVTFIELSLHCVKTLELTTAALLYHSSKVCKSDQVNLPDNK